MIGIQEVELSFCELMSAFVLLITSIDLYKNESFKQPIKGILFFYFLLFFWEEVSFISKYFRVESLYEFNLQGEANLHNSSFLELIPSGFAMVFYLFVPFLLLFSKIKFGRRQKVLVYILHILVFFPVASFFDELYELLLALCISLFVFRLENLKKYKYFFILVLLLSAYSLGRSYPHGFNSKFPSKAIESLALEKKLDRSFIEKLRFKGPCYSVLSNINEYFLTPNEANFLSLKSEAMKLKNKALHIKGKADQQYSINRDLARFFSNNYNLNKHNKPIVRTGLLLRACMKIKSLNTP
jgi:hypothetical protein